MEKKYCKKCDHTCHCTEDNCKNCKCIDCKCDKK
jgi:hypothetical protein